MGEDSTESVTVEAFSLNSPDDDALLMEIPARATYTQVVEAMKRALLENGTSSTFGDVKITKVLHAGKHLEAASRSSRLPESFDYYGFTGEPILFKYCKKSFPVTVRGVHEGTGAASSCTLTVEISDTLPRLSERLRENGAISVPMEPEFKLAGNNLLGPKDADLLQLGVKPGATLDMLDMTAGSFTIHVETFPRLRFDVRVHRSYSILDLKNKLQYMGVVPVEHTRLFFAGRQLYGEKTLADFGIAGGSTVHLVLRLRGGGGNFADLSDSSAMTPHDWSSDAPYWRTARPGLCLEGECRNQQCKAYSRMVVMNNGFRDFDLVRDANSTACPACTEKVPPITCAFNNCMWKFDGRKTGEPSVIQGPWRRIDDKYQRFDESSGVQWDRLLIRVRELQRSTAENVALPDQTWKECTICITDLASFGRDSRTLTCGHSFHKECIFEWARGSPWEVSCPNCRRMSPLQE